MQVTTPTTSEFISSPLPATLPAAARTRPALHHLSDRMLYIGGGMEAEGMSSSQLPWGVRLAGHDLMSAVSAARELAGTPFRPYGNLEDSTTAVAVFQTRAGAYLLTTIWGSDFHSDVVFPVDASKLGGLDTRRRDLVAIVGRDTWLHRADLTPAT